jgi:hypothetical protein
MSSRCLFVFGVYGDLSTSFQGATVNQLSLRPWKSILSPLEIVSSSSLCEVRAQLDNRFEVPRLQSRTQKQLQRLTKSNFPLRNPPLSRRPNHRCSAKLLGFLRNKVECFMNPICISSEHKTSERSRILARSCINRKRFERMFY